MRIFSALVIAVAVLGFAAPSLAATVNPTGGQVLVNRGDGYKRATGATNVKPGDQVVVNPGGGGTLVYPDGCIVDIAPGTVVTVAAKSPCSAGAFPSDTTFAVGAAVVGGGVAAGVLLSQDKSASP